MHLILDVHIFLFNQEVAYFIIQNNYYYNDNIVDRYFLEHPQIKSGPRNFQIPFSVSVFRLEPRFCPDHACAIDIFVASMVVEKSVI